MRLARVLTVTAIAASGVLVAGGLAMAAIPDGQGVIHGCYDTGGNLKIVDAGASCPKTFKAISCNQQGVAGTNGTNGVPPRKVRRARTAPTGSTARTVSLVSPGPTAPTGSTARTVSPVSPGPTEPTGSTARTVSRSPRADGTNGIDGKDGQPGLPGWRIRNQRDRRQGRSARSPRGRRNGRPTDGITNTYVVSHNEQVLEADSSMSRSPARTSTTKPSACRSLPASRQMGPRLSQLRGRIREQHDLPGPRLRPDSESAGHWYHLRHDNAARLRRSLGSITAEPSCDFPGVIRRC